MIPCDCCADDVGTPVIYLLGSGGSGVISIQAKHTAWIRVCRDCAGDNWHAVSEKLRKATADVIAKAEGGTQP